jgi:predicted MFS family arabinose efflux permease
MQGLGFAASMIGAAFILLLVYFIFDKKLDNQIKVEEEVDEEEKFHITDFTKLVHNPTFIWIALLCVTYYSAVFPFIGAYGPSILHHNFGFSMKLPEGFASLSFMEQARIYLTNGPKIAGLIPLGSIAFTPIFGSVVDRKGRAASMMLIGSILLIFSHITLAFSSSRALAYPALFSLGVAFSLVPAAMWPSVAKIVSENRLGTAYASMFTVQNWGLALFYWLPGFLVTLTNGEDTGAQASRDYTWGTVPFILLGFISIFLAVMLLKSNSKHDLKLEVPFRDEPTG